VKGLLLKMKNIVALVFTVTALTIGLIFGVYLEKNNPKVVRGGLPVGENELKDGQVYEVESFSFTSWGYLAQLREANALVSRQYRVTDITEMEPGVYYLYKIKDRGVKAEFTKIPKI